MSTKKVGVRREKMREKRGQSDLLTGSPAPWYRSPLKTEISAMPRPSRLILPHQTHHIVQRGNNRQAVFFSEDDRQLFLRWLGKALAAEGCALHAYVLMT